MKASSTGGVTFIYRIHWHVWLTHFPISFFLAAFIFQIIHLFPHDLTGAFEIATNVMLIAATAAMIPATWTGWRTWKRRYQGVHATQFQRKIAIGFAMLGVSIILTVWRTAFLPAFEDVPTGLWHWLYLLGNVVLFIGAVMEGFYGIRITHR